jgi:hypothetical protein
MEQKIEEYISWYKLERKNFVSNVYIDKSTWLKQKLSPYSNWDNRKIIQQELDFSAKAIAELANRGFPSKKKILSIAVLAISNRTEYISDQSDFYATLAALIGFITTIASIGQPLLFKIIIGFCALYGVMLSIKKRIELRQEIAHYKEIVNVLNQYKND